MWHSLVICLLLSFGAEGGLRSLNVALPGNLFFGFISDRVRLYSLNVTLPGNIFVGFIWCQSMAVIFKCDTLW